MNIDDLKSDLEQFIGTEHYYKALFGDAKYTDGIHYLAEKANCFWLLDTIFSYNRQEPFQIWELVVFKDKTAKLTMKENDGQEVKVKQEFTYTDFPTGKIKLYLCGGVLMLPSEY